MVISKDHVTMDLTKVHGVTEWPTPTKVKEVQSFLGFVNFYQKFIRNFSDIAHPLYTLTHKTQRWVWGSPKQEVFDALQKAVTSAPVLTFPSQSGHFHLKCNTSNFATRAVLSQVQADGMHQPITFMSKGFSDAEHNYQIHDKEMLAIMCTPHGPSEPHLLLRCSEAQLPAGTLVPLPLMLRLLPLPPTRMADGQTQHLVMEVTERMTTPTSPYSPLMCSKFITWRPP